MGLISDHRSKAKQLRSHLAQYFPSISLPCFFTRLSAPVMNGGLEVPNKAIYC